MEISGVAAVRNGYAVIGDDTNDYGRTWPSKDKWDITPEVKGPESIDVGYGPDGQEVWLVLGEDKRTLQQLNGPKYTFSEKYDEVCGRGVEGLAVRWKDGIWQVAVSWEGGFYKPYDEDNCNGKFVNPKIAILDWKAGSGTQGPEHEFELEVPIPNEKQRFRAPDLVWAGNELLVLLQSTNKKNKKKKHTWLQKFDLQGNQVGQPLKLEEQYELFQRGRNWEAMDWTLDEKSLVLGYDTDEEGIKLAILPFP